MYSNSPKDKDTFSITSNYATAKTLDKGLLVDLKKYFRETIIDTPSFLAGTLDELTNTIQRCLTTDYPSDWRLRRVWITCILEALEKSAAPPKYPKEGIEIESQEYCNVISEIIELRYLSEDVEENIEKDSPEPTKEKKKYGNKTPSDIHDISLALNITLPIHITGRENPKTLIKNVPPLPPPVIALETPQQPLT